MKEIIEYSGMSESDRLISLTVENGKIKAVIDLASNKLFTTRKYCYVYVQSNIRYVTRRR